MLILIVEKHQVSKAKKWHFSNMVAMIGHHLVNHVKLYNPEKAYQQRNRELAWQNSLFEQ